MSVQSSDQSSQSFRQAVANRVVQKLTAGMSAQNGTPAPAQPAPQQNPPRQGTLANRLNQQPAQNQNPPPASNSPFNRATNNTAAPTNEQVNYSTLPIHRTVVRFDLNGLGDPFYRLLGYDINPDYGHHLAVCKALESGGDSVNALSELLETAWQSYQLKGAALVYGWNDTVWKSVALPNPMPFPAEDFLDENADANQQKKEAAKLVPFICYRAIDMTLVLNVLARARSQLLLANSPLIFSVQYLNRSLVTDDPRLVTLARATGCLQEALTHAAH